MPGAVTLAEVLLEIVAVADDVGGYAMSLTRQFIEQLEIEMPNFRDSQNPINEPVEIELPLEMFGYETPEAALESEEEAHLQTIDERDAAEDFADRLAHAIGGDAIGEHSNLNCPWQNALDIADQRLANRPIDADHPESTCEDCGGLNVSWHVANDLWNQVVRSEGDYEPMLCPRCFAVRAFRAGVDRHWVLSTELLQPESL